MSTNGTRRAQLWLMVIAIAVTVWIWRAGRMLDATREMATLKSQVEALEKRVVALERR